MGCRFSQGTKVLVLAYATCLVVAAQQIATAPTKALPSNVPNIISYASVLKDETGRPINGSVNVTFLLYADAEGGTPLWIERQNVSCDALGHFVVRLGTTFADGLPLNLFLNGEARWLALQISGQAEQDRVLLVAVPYALKAKDAETVGGLPASAFVRAGNGMATAIDSAERKTVWPGRITGVTAGTDLTGGGTGGNVTLNMDTTKVPQLDTPNSFIGHQSVAGSITASGQLQGGAPGVLIKDGSGETMQIASNPSPTGASPGTVQFIPNAGTLVGVEAYSIGLISGTSGDFYCHHGLVAGGGGVCYFADVANDAGHLPNSFSQSVQFDSVNSAGIDVFTSVRANPQNSLEVSSGGSPGTSFGSIRQVPTTFADLPACGTTVEGTTATVTDSYVNAWGTTVAGGGTNHVLAYCDGTQWTVAAK